MVDSIGMMTHQIEHGGQAVVGQEMGFQTEFEQARMVGIVVVILGLDARIGQVLDFDVQAERAAHALDAIGQFIDRECLRELVKNPQLARIDRVLDREANAIQRVLEVEIAAGLTTRSIHSQRVPRDSLHDEAVEGCSKHFVVGEGREERLIVVVLIGLEPVDRPLHEIGDADVPDPTVVPEQIGVHDLGRVVEAAGLPGEERLLGSPSELQIKPPFGDIDIGCAVFAHRAELDQVAVGAVIPNAEDGVERDAEVVVQGQVRGLIIQHRIGGRGLLSVMDYDLGLDGCEDRVTLLLVCQINDMHLDVAAALLFPLRRTLMHVRDREEHLRVNRLRHGAAEVVVGDDDIVTLCREVHGGRPSEIAVTAENENTHD